MARQANSERNAFEKTIKKEIGALEITLWTNILSCECQCVCYKLVNLHLPNGIASPIGNRFSCCPKWFAIPLQRILAEIVGFIIRYPINANIRQSHFTSLFCFSIRKNLIEIDLFAWSVHRLSWLIYRRWIWQHVGYIFSFNVSNAIFLCLILACFLFFFFVLFHFSVRFSVHSFAYSRRSTCCQSIPMDIQYTIYADRIRIDGDTDNE